MRERVLALLASGLTYREAAAQLGVSPGCVAGHVRRHRKKVKPRIPISDEALHAAVEESGGNLTKAAKIAGVSRKTLTNRGIGTGRRYRPFAPNRATDPATREICDLIEKSEMSLDQIAARSGICVSSMRRWRRGEYVAKPITISWVREALGK
jgi:transposase-like protein